MERRKVAREFKREAVRLIRIAACRMRRGERNLSVHQSQLRSWVKALQTILRIAATLPRALRIAEVDRYVSPI